MPASTIRFRLVPLLALLAAACGSDPAVRPEPAPPEPVSHDIGFAASSPSSHIITSTECRISIMLVRQNGGDAPARAVDLGAVADKGTVTVPRSLVFDAGAVTATFELSYSCPGLAPGASDAVTVHAGDATHCMTIVRKSGEKTGGKYIRGFARTDVCVYTLDGEYVVEGEGIYRRISFVDGRPYVHGGSGVTDIADARAMLSGGGAWLPYAYSTPGSYDAAEGRFNLALADPELKPTIEYLVIDGENEWADCGPTMFFDRWCLPVVSINAELLDPDKHPWRVWAQQSVARPGIYRVIDPYRGDSPLALYNDARAGSVMTVDATNPQAVTITAVNTLFGNVDLAPVSVGGTGRMARGTLADTVLVDARPVLIMGKAEVTGHPGKI